MTVKEIAATLLAQNNILIITHKRPDGDTIGCAVGLCAALRSAGKTAWILQNPDATALFTPYLAGHIAPKDFAPTFTVSVDVAAVSLFCDNAKPYLDRKIDLAIDHHPSNEGFAKENYVEADKAACGEILYKIVSEMGPLTPAIAAPLYVAVSTDTGCFVYGNTTANTHRVAAALMDANIPYQKLNKLHFRTKSFKRLQVEAMLMEGMHLYDDGLIAIASISLSMMASLDAHEEDVEDIAAFMGQIEGVKTSVTIRELCPGECKLSMRTDPKILNATDTCAILGGGGHAAASGCTVFGSVTDAETAILAAIRQVQHG